MKEKIEKVFCKSTKDWRTKQLPELKNLKPYYGGIKKHNTPKEYIINYFRMKRPRTYTKDNAIQCSSRRYRSFSDLYYIVKAKFNNITFNEFCYIMTELIMYGFDSEETTFYGKKYTKVEFISVSYCGWVNKFVLNSHSTLFLKNENPVQSSIFIKKKKYIRNGRNIDNYIECIGIDGLRITDIKNAANEYIKKNG